MASKSEGPPPIRRHAMRLKLSERLAQGLIDFGDHRDSCPRSWRRRDRADYVYDPNAICNCGFLEVLNAALKVIGESPIPVPTLPLAAGQTCGKVQ